MINIGNLASIWASRNPKSSKIHGFYGFQIHSAPLWAGEKKVVDYSPIEPIMEFVIKIKAVLTARAMVKRIF